MARIPKRFSGPGSISNVAVTKYTVPASSRAVLKYVHVQNSGTIPADFTLSVGADATAVRLFDGYPIAGDGVLEHFCYYAFDEGEIIQAKQDLQPTALILTLDGDEIVLG